MSLALPSEVEQEGGLIPELFDFTNSATKQASLDALVQQAIDRAEAWMSVYMAGNFVGNNTAATTQEATIQKEAEIYLALAKLTATLRAKKTYGTHFPIDSEDGASYDQLLEQDWEALAKGLLAKWIEVEVGGPGAKGFALPYFSATNGIDPLLTTNEDQQLREDLDQARGISTPDLATVTL